ncbi:MAG TPA: UDP-galactopyranose mutase [Gemmataceae bacterium]|nr:UDP-galactopyranose mutase [Gemmataceae bacterium]
MRANYVIVGSGLTGGVIARSLADAGEQVVVLDRRPHLGGNVADFTHPSGINVHRYGPHLFRTVSDEIWRFVNRFADFHPYKHVIKSRVDEQLQNWPIAGSYIRRVCGESWRPEFEGRPSNFEEAALALMPRIIYEKFVKGYSEKQWGVQARTLSAKLCKRFDVRADDDPYLTPHAKYQGIPTEGYSRMMERMLDGIPLVLNFDYLKDREAFKARKKLIFTGPIDEYFDFELGRLHYRGQKRQLTYIAETDWAQPCGQVNSPCEGEHIRDVEWKHMMEPQCAARIRGTLITRETPWSPPSPEHYEYPFPDDRNQDLYEQYRMMAKEYPELLICGRLGEYRYYDMDHAIGRALTISKRLFSREESLQYVVTES